MAQKMDMQNQKETNALLKQLVELNGGQVSDQE
jgi:hypothetical protein